MRPVPAPTTCIAALLFGCATPTAELGSRDRPVRCDGERGEIRYLSRLRCPSGAPPHIHFQRRGPRTADGHETDEFLLRCVTDNRTHRVTLDREHPGYEEDAIIEGFTRGDGREVPELGDW